MFAALQRLEVQSDGEDEEEEEEDDEIAEVEVADGNDGDLVRNFSFSSCSDLW